jgi:glycosyltransferase involved in cell wall biosynthesis
MRRYLKQHGIRVVHSYDASGIFGGAVARMCGVPLVMTSQLSYRDILDPRTQKFLRWSDSIAHSILVNCEAMRRYMVEDEGIPRERIELCFNGVDTAQFHSNGRARRPEVRDASIVIGTVCALRPEKALPLLQEGFARMRRSFPGATLLIVGSGEELPALQARGAELGIAGDTVFIPATTQVAEWMRSIDVFVLPSYSEAFSNSLLEAMACGCACVGSRVGGTPELLGDDERGLLFPRGDAEGLSSALERLAESEALRRELGGRAARFAREKLSIAIAAETTAGIYEKLLRRRGYAGLLAQPAPVVAA